MKQTFSLRLSFIVISLLILLTYSSEMNFMPNYEDRPDKWHLFIPMLIFYPTLLLFIGRTILKKNIGFQKTEILVSAIIILVGFAMLNNPKGNSQIVGYSTIFIIFFIAILRLFMERQNKN